MRWLSIMLTLALLGGLYAQTEAFPRPEDAVGFHARAAVLLGSVPYQIGEWQGVDMPVPPGAEIVTLVSSSAGGGEVRAFLTKLAVEERVGVATQKQALCTVED